MPQTHCRVMSSCVRPFRASKAQRRVARTADLPIGSSARPRSAGTALNLALGDRGKHLRRDFCYCFAITLLLGPYAYAQDGALSLTVTSEPVARLPVLDYGSYDDCVVPRSFGQATKPDAPPITLDGYVLRSAKGGLFMEPLLGGLLRLRFLNTTQIWDAAGTPLHLSEIRAGEALTVWVRGCQVLHGATEAYASAVIACHSRRSVFDE